MRRSAYDKEPTVLCRRSSEVGAVCGKAARTVLCGGRAAMHVPTAIHNPPLLCLVGVESTRGVDWHGHNLIGWQTTEVCRQQVIDDFRGIFSPHKAIRDSRPEILVASWLLVENATDEPRSTVSGSRSGTPLVATYTERTVQFENLSRKYGISALFAPIDFSIDKSTLLFLNILDFVKFKSSMLFDVEYGRSRRQMAGIVEIEFERDYPPSIIIHGETPNYHRRVRINPRPLFDSGLIQLVYKGIGLERSYDYQQQREYADVESESGDWVTLAEPRERHWRVVFQATLALYLLGLVFLVGGQFQTRPTFQNIAISGT